MRVSVIIPTYNGAQKIMNILRALEVQTFKDFEVIVVIDGSTDGTYDLLSAAKFTFKHFHIINQENKGRAAVRNRGAKEAKGDILVFFDDDIRPFADCLAQHVWHHQQHPGSVCVGPTIEDWSLIKTDFQRFRYAISQEWEKMLPASGEPMTKRNIILPAANCSISAASFWKIGGFDERLKDAEDFEFSTRTFQNQVPAFFHHEAKCFHDDYINCKSYIKRQREYTLAQMKVLEIRPEIKGEFLNTQSYNPSYVKRAIFNLVAHPVWVNLIDSERIFNRFLPRPLRYKFYSTVVWGLARVFPERKI